MRRHLALAAGAAFALMACGDARSSRITGPAGPLANNGSAKEFVTTGGAEITVVVDLQTERYSFVANRENDGSVVGELTAIETVLGKTFTFHADVTCFTIDGNQAWLEGVITHSNAPVFPPAGTTIIWTVEDNGEGGNATGPDKASQIISFPPGPNCSAGVDQILRPVTSGNVQVHAGS
jgi:hypothetical protein